ncbi:Lsr2 family protein [uncultured Pseudokineococcus sp.]|uniref:histone-like nucleoid-structuring protein Lsr2 n=1 Tax=uncultured Pseudokineococcus sp. TaxID=1642928 RepID=UPI00260853F4|nr:Lsr2 family protein [uncultured Pseudokineococcus sp.]
MAQKTKVILIDDVEGGEADETVTFALDGVSYEIDLTSERAAQLRDALAPWVGHARKAGGRSSGGARRSTRSSGSSSSSSSSAGGVDTAAVREWARENGHTVSERGRISGAVLEAYKAAQG